MPPNTHTHPSYPCLRTLMTESSDATAVPTLGVSFLCAICIHTAPNAHPGLLLSAPSTHACFLNTTQKNHPGMARYPLSRVIRDCEQRWAQDIFDEANSTKLANKLLLAGDVCERGYGGAPNTTEAAKWWHRAADATDDETPWVRAVARALSWSCSWSFFS
jgi:hypothetical protein